MNISMRGSDARVQVSVRKFESFSSFDITPMNCAGCNGRRSTAKVAIVVKRPGRQDAVGIVDPNQTCCENALQKALKKHPGAEIAFEAADGRIPPRPGTHGNA